MDIILPVIKFTIVRKHEDLQIVDKILEEGVSWDDVKKHCNNLEASSKTCKDAVNIEYTKKHGDWFDSFYEELLN